MNAAVFILALLIAAAVIVTLARRLGVAYPIPLVLAGLVLGSIPGVPLDIEEQRLAASA